MRRLLVAGLLLWGCLVGAGTLIVQQTKVPPQAIVTSVTRSSGPGVAVARRGNILATGCVAIERFTLWSGFLSQC
jgi:hypothetical protein